jgi:hypothetical protein
MKHRVMIGQSGKSRFLGSCQNQSVHPAAGTRRVSSSFLGSRLILEKWRYLVLPRGNASRSAVAIDLRTQPHILVRHQFITGDQVDGGVVPRPSSVQPE